MKADRIVWMLLSIAFLFLSTGAMAQADPAALAQSLSKSIAGQAAVSQPALAAGEVTAKLSDGRWLIVGTDGSLRVQAGSNEAPLQESLSYPRVGETVTALPDGNAVVLGGQSPNGTLVTIAEVVDPRTGSVEAIAAPGLDGRTDQSATLMTDGRILLAGGYDASGNPLATAQIWNPWTQQVEPLTSSLYIARAGQSGALLNSGDVLVWNGVPGEASELSGELFDPNTNSFIGVVSKDDPRIAATLSVQTADPFMVGSVPSDGATGVGVDAHIGVRFSRPLSPESISDATLTLVGPNGAVPGHVVDAADGKLLFFLPTLELLPGTQYTLFVNGASNSPGASTSRSAVQFFTQKIADAPQPHKEGGVVDLKVTYPKAKVTTTVASQTVSQKSATKPLIAKKATTSPIDKPSTPQPENLLEDWVPSDANRHGEWHILNLSDDPPFDPSTRNMTQAVPPQGRTGVAGQVLKFNGKPVEGAIVSVNRQSTRTDAHGQFMLTGIQAGSTQLKVDGTTVLSEGRHYTKHFIGLRLAAGKVTKLPAPVFLPRVSLATEVAISSPADHEIVLTHPAMPGLEVHIPKGAVLREYDGQIVRRVSITPIPLDRAPYPPPVKFSVYFTLQPGGAYLDGNPGQAIKIVYPNYEGLPAGAPVDFWNYDPGQGGWKIYGHGRVSPDRRTVLADKSLGFRQVMTFGYAQSSGKNSPAASGPGLGNCSSGGDPVDCATGLFLHRKTDLRVEDTIPIDVTRVYRQGDATSNAFGVGGNLGVDLWLYSPTTNAPVTDLVLSDGGRIHYYATNWTTPNAAIPNEPVWVNTDSPTIFKGSTLTFYRYSTSGDAATITLRDGTVLSFSQSPDNLLDSIVDRYGNKVTITRVGRSATQITSPNGRTIQLSYDSFGRVTQAQDNIGRTVSYTYDSSGRLASAADAGGNAETFTYDPVTNGMATVTDRRNNLMVTNQFDAKGRVSQQTLADGAIWQFAYTEDASGNITQTTITDPRTLVRKDSYNINGFITQRVLAVGRPEQATYVFQRDSNNQLLSVTDPLARVTAIKHNDVGEITSVTALSGTANAVTYAMTYESTYHQLQSVTDPLGHNSTIGRDSRGSPTSLIDPLGHTSTLTTNSAGLITAYTDALNHTTQLGLQGGDPQSLTDALGRATQLLTDSVGRLRGVVDPLGNKTQYVYDSLDRLASVTDALGGQTLLTYDNNGNLLTVKDPRNVTQTFTYDNRNRRHTYVDPKGATETYNYDSLGNLISVVDRKNQTTSYGYDGLNRISTITFADSSTITVTWDAGNRPTQILDSVNGTITRTYDALDRLTAETTSQGTVSYTYDNAGRRQSMTVGANAPFNYTFDNANRLTQIAQGSSTILFGYDNANRRISISLPNGVVAALGYDNANQLLTTGFDKGVTHLGDLSYTYNNDGRRISVGGSLGATLTPTLSASPNYDAANRLTSFNGSTLVYDANGNLTTYGTTSYTWNTRNQLAAVSLGGSSFSYDALGRRRSATIGGATTSYQYDGGNAVAVNGTQLLDGLGIDEIYGRLGTTPTTYLRDALGGIASVTNSAGTVTGSYAYSPYGESAVSGTQDGSSQYTSRENDGVTGLYYYRARYYSPQMGRFISEDPFRTRAGLNFYAYVAGNPIGDRDPLGLCPDRLDCFRTALVDKGFAVWGDIFGAIPFVGNVANAINLGLTGYGIYGAVTGTGIDSVVGAATSSAGAATQVADTAVGGTKVLPVIGNIISAVSAVWDINQGVETYNRCMEGQ